MRLRVCDFPLLHRELYAEMTYRLRAHTHTHTRACVCTGIREETVRTERYFAVIPRATSVRSVRRVVGPMYTRYVHTWQLDFYVHE